MAVRRDKENIDDQCCDNCKYWNGGGSCAKGIYSNYGWWCGWWKQKKAPENQLELPLTRAM